MKIISPWKVRLGLTLKVYKKSGAVSTYRKQSRMVFFNLIGSAKGQKYDLKVYYRRGLINEGVYYNKKDLIHAFRAFTEKSLLEDVEGWKK